MPRASYRPGSISPDYGSNVSPAGKRASVLASAGAEYPIAAWARVFGAAAPWPSVVRARCSRHRGRRPFRRRTFRATALPAGGFTLHRPVRTRRRAAGRHERRRRPRLVLRPRFERLEHVERRSEPCFTANGSRPPTDANVLHVRLEIVPLLLERLDLRGDGVELSRSPEPRARAVDSRARMTASAEAYGPLASKCASPEATSSLPRRARSAAPTCSCAELRDDGVRPGRSSA